MKSWLVPVVIVVLIAVGVLLYFATASPSPSQVPLSPVSGESQQVATTTYAAPKLAIDLYPLYTDVIWNNTHAESVTIGTTTYMGAGANTVAIDSGMDPGSISIPFSQYYSGLLLERGWHLDDDLAAGGHTGGQEGYRNGNGLILVRYTFDYLNNPTNAPSECPCTVTLSLFSNVEN